MPSLKPKKPTAQSIGERDGRTETANAARLVDKFGGQIRYVVEWGDWIVWDGRRWQRDVGGILVQDKAVQVARDLWREIADNLTKRWDDAIQQIYSFAKASNSAKGIAAMVTLARSLVPIHVGELDADPWLFNVTNGTLDLRTGFLRPNKQADYITKLCPTAYQPEARCPIWQGCLNDIFQGKADLVRYLHRLIGYGLTGDVSEQILPIFWGEGWNGKSTIIGAIQHVMGEDYSGTAPIELFVVDRNGGSRHPTELMTLQGKRLMIGSETEAGDRLTEAKIKLLSGGDQMTGRGMYENFQSFLPTHKLILSTNHKPEIRGSDEAIWRRPKLIPFLAKFNGSKRDKNMKDKLKTEAEGILAWAVRGCVNWRKHGLAEPEEVRLATKQYRGEQDVIGTFLKERCEEGEAYHVGATELYAAFQEFKPDSDITQTRFGREMTERGFVKDTLTRKPQKGLVIRRGLQFRSSKKR